MNERYAITRGTDYEAVILKSPHDRFTQEEIERFKREYEAKGYVYWGKDVFLGGLEGLVFKIPKSSQQQTQTKQEFSIPQEVQTRPDVAYLTRQRQEVEQQIQKVEQVERRMELFEDVKQKAQDLINVYEQALEKYKDVKSAEDVAKLAGYFSKLGTDIRLFIERELRGDHPEIVELRKYLGSISAKSMNLAYSLLQQRDKILSGEYEIDKEKVREFIEDIRSALLGISQDISSIRFNITKEEIGQIKSELYQAKGLIESELEQRIQMKFEPTKEEYIRAFKLLKEIEEWKRILRDPKYKKQLTPEVESEIWKEIKRKEEELLDLYLAYPEMQKVISEMRRYFENPFAQFGYNIQAIFGKRFFEYPVKFFTERTEGVAKKFEEALVETIVSRTLKPPTTKEGFLEAHKDFWLYGAGSFGTGYAIGAGAGAVVGTAVSKGPSLFSKIGEILKPVSSKVGTVADPIITNIKFYGSKLVHGAEKVASKVGSVIPQPVKDFFGKAGGFVGKGFIRAVRNPHIVFAGTEAGIRGYEAYTELSAGKTPKEVGEKIASEVLRDVAMYYPGIKGFEEAYQHFGTKKASTYLIAKAEGMKDVEMAEYLRSLRRPEELAKKLKEVGEYKVFEFETPSGIAKITKISKEKPIFFKDIVSREEIPIEEILKKGKVVKEEYPFKLIEYRGGLYLFSLLPPKKIAEGDLINVLRIGKETEKYIGWQLVTPEKQTIGAFRISGRKSLYLPVLEEEEKAGLRILPKMEPPKRDVIKDLAEYYEKQLKKEAEKKAAEEALRKAKELEKSQVASVENLVKEGFEKSEEKALEREIKKAVRNLAGIEYTYVVKPPQIKPPIIPFSKLDFPVEPTEENVRKTIRLPAPTSILSPRLDFINKVGASLSKMLERLKQKDITRVRDLDLSQMTRQLQLDLQTPTRRLLIDSMLTERQRTIEIAPPRLITRTPRRPPLPPFRPVGIPPRRPPPKIPIIKLDLPFSSKSKNVFKGFEKFFGLPKSKYEPSLFGIMFGIRTKNINRMLTGLEIRGIPIRTRRRK
jgi:hypothetical protein